MKKILLTGSLILASLGLVNAQGTIKFYNIGAQFLVTTNGGNVATTGKLTTTANSYYFALFYTATAPTSSNPLTGGWSLATSDGSTPLIGVNSTLVNGGISGTGTTSGTPVNGVALGGADYYEVVGWSANLGTTWAQVSSQYQTGNWLTQLGYFGISSESGLITAGGAGGPPPSSAAALFGTSGQIASGFSLNSVATPEPTTMALAGFGIASLLAFRRKK